MKEIKAVNDHVIVKEIVKEEEKTESGIIIPQTVRVEPQKTGKVISVGEDVKKIKKDDMVMFHQSGGQAIILNGEVLRVLKKNEIYGVIVEQEIK